MHGDPSNPLGESWGGSFEKLSFSPVKLVNRSTTQKDTVAVYTIVEWRIDGPDLEIAQDSACFTLAVETGSGKQSWPGYYLETANTLCDTLLNRPKPYIGKLSQGSKVFQSNQVK
jgi:hypothetical protein